MQGRMRLPDVFSLNFDDGSVEGLSTKPISMKMSVLDESNLARVIS